MVPSAENKTDVRSFLDLSGSIPVIDVRSPSEFNYGHIPGAHNIALFDDNERAVVGTLYKKEGRSSAVLKGIELSGPCMHEKLKAAMQTAVDGKLLVHCWRGGMRSEAMAWLFSLGGIETTILEGGYKSYRHYILEELSKSRKIIVLGGMTGSGKTHILRRIGELGNTVIDLERLANHKGSAFGALGQEPQPSSEHFANLLYDEWMKSDNLKPLWLEDESRNIGSVFMPDTFYRHLQVAPAIVLRMPVPMRLPRLIEEYSKYPAARLKESIMKISKRLGGSNAAEAAKAVDEGDFSKAIEITLGYYDKTYLFGVSRKESGQVIYVDTETDDIEINAQIILEASRKIRF